MVIWDLAVGQKRDYPYSPIESHYYDQSESWEYVYIQRQLWSYAKPSIIVLSLQSTIISDYYDTKQQLQMRMSILGKVIIKFYDLTK